MVIDPLERTGPLRIGTRGSPLALAQAHEVRDRICKAFTLDKDQFEIVVIKVAGDMMQDRPLNALGGKGLFTREIEDALLDGEIDMAVHSMKDMPVEQPDGLYLNCFLPREDPRDAFVSLKYDRLADLPQGAVVGTSSVRRRAQLLAARPDLQVVEFRGNVQTRLRKLEEGVADATLLAMAGLNRLGRADVVREAIDPEVMLPAVGQGVIGVEYRWEDEESEYLLEGISDYDTSTRLAAERAFLEALDGSCQTPIAALAELLPDDTVRLRGQILRPDGSASFADELTGSVEDVDALGDILAKRLLRLAGPGFF
ncbi:MAG: hydroxymethylbilane synthase [Rubellimicrobium sp.]|nr:hydroxymethylbilane synthase [Rubellimicrobium sp.]